MRKEQKSNIKGRSMIEMLGVLAIIAVLTIGGLAGYSQAMAKHKLNKAQDQIFMIITNVRTSFAPKGSYVDLNNKSAIEMMITPHEMLPQGNKTSPDNIRSTFGGKVNINVLPENSGKFYIEFQEIGYSTCVSLMSTDWGTDGLVSIGTEEKTFYSGELPVPPNKAAKTCNLNGTNNITWTFY